MVKAVFFDFYHTLVRYDPPREELQARVLRDFGINAMPEVFCHPLVIADEFIYRELARRPLSQRTSEDKMVLYYKYQEIVLKEAGIDVSPQLIPSLLAKLQRFDMKLVLFDDVVPALTDLRNRGLTLGLISNVDRDVTSPLTELGLLSLLKIVVTSQSVGYSKPQPEIFQEAMRQARVNSSEAIYVGDQYQIDIVGANNAGMKGVLLDRNGYFQGTVDCPRIQSLTHVSEHL